MKISWIIGTGLVLIVGIVSLITYWFKKKNKLYFMVNAQELLDKEYPFNGSSLGELDSHNKGKTRNEITDISLAYKKLEGPLVIKDFPQLERIYLAYNKLTSLTFINCLQVKAIRCGDNNLTNLSVSHPQAVIELNISHNQLSGTLDLSKFKNLKFLYCYNNQLTNLILTNCSNLTEINANNNQLTDLSAFSHLANLETLDISNNNFTGSLEPLKNLKHLNISQTKLMSGLEYLPENLETIRCHWNQFPELEKYKKGLDEHDYQAWRKDNQTNKTFFLQKENELLRQQLEISKSLTLSSQLEKRKSELEHLTSQAKLKLEERESLLDIMLKVQNGIVNNSINNFTPKSLAGLQDSLSKNLDKQLIEKICQKQREITHLEAVRKFITSYKEEEDKLKHLESELVNLQSTTQKLTKTSEPVLESHIEIPTIRRSAKK